MSLTHKRASADNGVLSAGITWVRDSSKSTLEWSGTTPEGHVCSIVKRGEYNYFWSLATPESAPEIVASGTTSAEAFWHAADDVRKAIKTL